jgi:predicted nucleotidyltransferase component of viral defense system
MDSNALRKLAGKTGFDIVTLEKDYALTWLISGIYSRDSPIRDILIFKGGTAIRKVYFPEWRLSEDLDFTVVDKIDVGIVKDGFKAIFKMLDSSGITFSLGDFDSTKHGIFANVQFVGPLNYKNRIAHDISLTEKMVDKPAKIRVKPDYSDVPEFEATVYSLNEIVVEKVRSMIQRTRARDYYDVWRLMKEKNPDVKTVRNLLIKKCEITGIKFKPELIFEESRLSEARSYWNVALTRLTKDLPEFDTVIAELRVAMQFLRAS